MVQRKSGNAHSIGRLIAREARRADGKVKEDDVEPTDDDVEQMAKELYREFWGGVETPSRMEDVHWLAVGRLAIRLGAKAPRKRSR